MSNQNRRHVVPGPDRTWQVKKEGAKRASSTHATQKEAIEAADRIVKNAGGGETVTHDKHGQIRDSKTVKPGNDPFPPRDKK